MDQLLQGCLGIQIYLGDIVENDKLHLQNLNSVLSDWQPTMTQHYSY